jgi:hypothetical protein
MSKSKPPLALTPAVFHILRALFGKERHGYDIMRQVKADSQGAVKMGAGTLYGSLDRLIEAGLARKATPKIRVAFSIGSRRLAKPRCARKRSGCRAWPSLRAASSGACEP